MSTLRKLLLLGAVLIGAIAVAVLCYGAVATPQLGVSARGAALFAIAGLFYMASRLA